MWRGTVAVNPWNQVRGCSHHQASGVRFPNLAVILISLNLAWCCVAVVDHDGDMSHGAGVGVMILICQAGSRHSLISGSVSPSPGVTCHVSHSAPLILKCHNSATAFCVSRQQPAVSAASCLVAQCLCSHEELPGGFNLPAFQELFSERPSHGSIPGLVQVQP